MKQVELWQWRYRSPKTGCSHKTLLPITEQEASMFPGAERIEGTLLMLEVDDSEFVETTPRVHGIHLD